MNIEKPKVSPKRRARGLFWEKGLTMVSGCTPVSPGCQNCWAMAMEDRFQGGDHRVRFHADRLTKPFHRRKPTIYAIWNDLFHPEVKENQRLVTLIAFSVLERHRFLICTKRTKELLTFGADHPLARFSGKGNIYFGATMETEKQIGRAADLGMTQGIRRYLSLEPLLGPIPQLPQILGTFGIHQVLVGGEAGPGARECQPRWIRSVVDDCEKAKTPCYVKQLGNFDGGKRYSGKRASPITIADHIGRSVPRELIWEQ